MLFGIGTAAVAALVYGLSLYLIQLTSPSQTTLFTQSLTDTETQGLKDLYPLHYWAAWWAIVAGMGTILLGAFGAFIAAIFFRNEKSPISPRNH